jgi:hypothetical protein
MEQKCRVARDCISGRCGNGVCVERPYTEGEPVPSGYVVKMSNTDAAASTRRAGLLFLAVGYAGAYLSALSLPSELGKMYVPLLGPWLTLKDVEGDPGKVLLAADGAVQLAGAVLVVGGLLGAGKQLVRETVQPEETEALHVSARLGPGDCRVELFARF